MHYLTDHDRNPGLKKWLTKSNVGNILFFAAVLAILFIPSAKSLLIRGLMDVGFFQPDIEHLAKAPVVADITFKSSTGKTISLTELKGKVIFINFWATWCPPCLAELPAINSLHQKLSDNPNVVFLLVDADSKLNKSVPFMKDKGYNLPVFEALTDVPASISGPSIPTTVVINNKGQMVYNHLGIANYNSSKFMAYLQQLAAE